MLSAALRAKGRNRSISSPNPWSRRRCPRRPSGITDRGVKGAVVVDWSSAAPFRLALRSCVGWTNPWIGIHARRSPLRAGLGKPTLYTFGEPELIDLDDRTAHLLRLRSGIGDGLLYTLDEVGEKIGISRERVRQIQNDGLLRIRQFREAQRHLREEPKWRRPQPELQSASRKTAAPDSPATLSAVSDSSFPGWELYVANFVHPLKVAIVEALCWMGAPLSAVQLTKLCSGGGESFREPN